MELPPATGAGPESTGTETEQLQLFEVEDLEHVAFEIESARRPHWFRPRFEPLHTDEHHVVRGERLDSTCFRRPWRRP
jgi:hypothetical protein